MAFSDYNISPAANTTIGGKYTGENMARSDVDAVLRQLAADGKLLNNDVDTLETSVTTANALAAVVGSIQGSYPNSAETAVPRGVTSTTGIVGGSGGTNGTFDLGVSGGTAGANAAAATGTFTVSGGALTAITITSPGYGYTSAPTLAFTASAGLTGASATAVIDYLVTTGKFYFAAKADGNSTRLYQNVAGTATLVSSGGIEVPSKTYLDDQVSTVTDALYAPDANLPLSKLMAFYDFTRAQDNIVPASYGTPDIDLDDAPSNVYEKTANGVLTRGGCIQTGIFTGARSFTYLYRGGEGETGSKFLLSGGASVTSGTLIQEVTAAESHSYGGNGADMHPLLYNTGNGLGCYSLNMGGWGVYHREMASAQTTRVGLGGAATITNFRMAELESGMLFVWNDVLTDDETEAVYRWIRAQVVKRGIYLHVDDCPEKQDLFIVLGDSTADGRSLITGLPTAERTALVRQARIANVTPTAAATYRKFDELEVGFNGQNSSPTTLMGPAYGIAKTRKGVVSTEGPCNIVMVGYGGSYSAAAGLLSVTDDTTWNAGTNRTTGLLYVAMKQIQYSIQQLLKRGIGFDKIVVGSCLGLNDMTSTTLSPDATTVANRYQAIYDVFKATFPGVNVWWRQIRPHTFDPAQNATAASNTRGGQNITFNLNVSNPYAQHIDIDPIHTGGTNLEPDLVHPNATASVAYGLLIHDGQ